jgi:hypothetical protein
VARRCSPPPEASKGGFIQGLLNLFGGRKRAKKAEAALDRTPYRPRAADLLRELQAGAGDVATRVAVLRAVIDRLEALFRDLVTAGDRDRTVRRLGEAVLAVRTFLAEASPAEAVVLGTWQQVEAALRDWLALPPGSPPGSAPPAAPRGGLRK